MCGFCGWIAFAIKIEEMLEDRRYAFADSMLRGILRTVRQQRHATEGQAEAVQNIEESVR